LVQKRPRIGTGGFADGFLGFPGAAAGAPTMPGSGGGPNANTRAPAIRLNFRFHSSASAFECSAGSSRSFQSSNPMNISAEFGKLSEFRMFIPEIASADLTPFVLPTISSTCFSNASVRCCTPSAWNAMGLRSRRAV
jgi:hypothetical protein